MTPYSDLLNSRYGAAMREFRFDYQRRQQNTFALLSLSFSFFDCDTAVLYRRHR